VKIALNGMVVILIKVKGEDKKEFE